MEGPPAKAELRREFRERRRNLTPLQRASQNESINRSVISLVQETGAKSISAFLAFDGEPDLLPALNELCALGVDVALPVVGQNGPGGKSLEFRRWRQECKLTRNAMGIEEPVLEDTVPLRDLDVVLVPLVAWDQSGNRLGMGAGYYDRALSGLRDSQWPLRVGVGYSIQQATHLRAEPWDVPLHEVITENGRFTCTG